MRVNGFAGPELRSHPRHGLPGIGLVLPEWGAKRGAICGRREATRSLLHRSIPPIYQVSSDDQLHRPTVEISFASKGSALSDFESGL